MGDFGTRAEVACSECGQPTAWPEPGGQCGKCFVRFVAQQLNDQVATLAPLLLPGGVRAGKFWRSSGASLGAAGDSHMVQLDGLKPGSWANYLRDKGDPAGKGDMLKLVMLTVGEGDMGKAIKWSRGYLGLDSMDPHALARHRDRAKRGEEWRARELAGDVEKRRLNAERLWGHSSPLAGTPAMKYLEGRGIDFARLGKLPGAMRFRAGLWSPEHRRELPAMMTAVMGLDGQHKQTHCTFIERLPDGRWVNVKTAKGKSYKIIHGSPCGAHMPLWKGRHRCKLADIPAGTPVYASEGIEDGLTVAMADPARRVLAAGTLGCLVDLALPAQAGDFILIGQHDGAESQAEATLERALATQQQAAVADGSGRRVLILWPAAGFKDVNDELRGVRM